MICKFVRTDFFNFALDLFICLPPEFSLSLDWCVFSLCTWGLIVFIWSLIFFTWFIFFDAFEEDRHHLADET